MIKVSLIVPIYNTEKYLEKCINSLTNQTLKDIEIILINDGTKDNSEKIINQFNDNRITYIKKENEGKPKRVAKIAGLNKFLRIYYARVMEVYC